MEEGATHQEELDLSDPHAQALKVSFVGDRKYVRMPNLPKQAIQTMKKWLVTHRESPYPDAATLSYLVVQTGLKKRQV